MPSSSSIGVFDSGVGGLTVLRALREALPREDFVYLGDTARLPYGTKTPDTVARYALQAAERLLREKIKLLVVACNTASALALPFLRRALPDLPCLGVVEPGAAAAAKASRNGRIVVLATESTARSGAYPKAIRALRPEAEIEGLACNLLVSLAEEGWTEGREAQAVVERYLRQIRLADYDTLVLGCTHFPLLAPLIRTLLPEEIALVDSAETTARAVAACLKTSGLARTDGGQGEARFLVTDGPERFQALAERFLGGKRAESVETISL